MKIAIIGGGAAGFFSALAAKENYPEAEVIIFEKTGKLLSKVKISGGGRCNLTNGVTSIAKLAKAYPRGGRELKKVFPVFNTKHTMEWFEARGVPLVIQDDGCVFPVSQKSESIIDCFLKEADRLQVKIRLNLGVKEIIPIGEKIKLNFFNNEPQTLIFDKVIVAVGGVSKRKNLAWLEKLGHKIETPVPSLFTFNIPASSITGLMGIVVENAIVSIQGTKLTSSGALLITHWGMSGPVILKLSAFGAKILYKNDYNFNVQVNWAGEKNHDNVRRKIEKIIYKTPMKLLTNIRPYDIPKKLWLLLLEKSNFSEKKKWNELGKKGINKLVNILTNDIYTARGKTTFREEFVTCGGVSFESVDISTMQSKVVKNLYFAGEILNIDGVTGGYNFQAAWTTGFIAGKLNSIQTKKH